MGLEEILGGVLREAFKKHQPPEMPSLPESNPAARARGTARYRPGDALGGAGRCAKAGVSRWNVFGLDGIRKHRRSEWRDCHELPCCQSEGDGDVSAAG